MAECRRLAFQVSEEEVVRARNQVDGSVLNFLQYVVYISAVNILFGKLDIYRRKKGMDGHFVNSC